MHGGIIADGGCTKISESSLDATRKDKLSSWSSWFAAVLATRIPNSWRPYCTVSSVVPDTMCPLFVLTGLLKSVRQPRLLGKQLSDGNCCGVSCKAKRKYSRFVSFEFYRRDEGKPAFFVPTSMHAGDVDGGRVVIWCGFAPSCKLVDLE